jgi:quaternary ammonium compound-resistance protein SugE
MGRGRGVLEGFGHSPAESPLSSARGGGVMSWVYLFLAGVLEIVWAIGLKYTEGFTRLWPSVITIAVAWLSFYLLALAVKTIPVGTGYAIWTGIGAAGVAILGMILFGEPATTARFVFLALIIVGIVGLKLSAGAP